MRSSFSTSGAPQHSTTRNKSSALISVVADLNDSAIEHMKVGAYEKANAILVEAIHIMEGTPNRLIDPLMYPLQFSVTSNCPTVSLLVDTTNTFGSSYTVPCTQTPAAALSFAFLTTGTGSSRPLVGSMGSPPASRSFGPSSPVPTPSRSDGGSSNNNNNDHNTTTPNGATTSFAAAARSLRRQRLTVRLPASSDENATTMNQQQTAIYNRAFVLHKNTCCNNPRIASAILAYNAALCAHLHSVVTGNSGVTPHRALCLYSAAYTDVLGEQQQQTLDWLLLRMQQQQIQMQMQGSVSTTTSSTTNTTFSSLSEANWLWNENSRTTVLLQAALCHNMAAIHGDCFWNLAHARLLRCQLAAIIHWTAFSQMDTTDCTCC